MNDDVKLVGKPDDQNKAVWTLFLVGLAFLILLFITGAVTDNLEVQRVLMLASVGLIVSSILWGIRRKIASVIISYGILLVVYFVCALVAWVLVGQVYSWGWMTITIISAFVFWLSHDKQITWDDGGKTLLFVILMGVANWSGWLGNVDGMIATLLSGQLPI